MEKAGGASIPTMWGPFKAYCYKSMLDGIEHIAMVKVRKSQLEFSIFGSVLSFPLFPNTNAILDFNLCIQG